MKRKILANTYGSAFPVKQELDRKILSRYPISSAIMSITGCEIGFTDDRRWRAYLSRSKKRKRDLVAELPPHQKKYNDEDGDGVVFPTVLIPNPKSVHQNLKELIRDQKPWLESVLHKSCAILFRGFTSSVSSASDFNDVVEAFGFEELPYVGGAAPVPTSSAVFSLLMSLRRIRRFRSITKWLRSVHPIDLMFFR
ncbi:hypothetical protein L6452_42043 [Arctium lappa]|uniref:Uncharacterized protein n=1 Tax=Arctium lappa TaxID=4217 RepID=A0ACB8XH37_ARCLA|nr:hypothetical protein L6452_42043 [Arctium lappa]